MRNLRNYLLFTLMILSSKSYTQEIYGKADIWSMLMTTYHIDDYWSVGNELHFRFDDWFNENEQLLIRPFVTFTPNKGKIGYTLGYTYVKTYPYSKYPLPASQHENNIWQQVNLKQVLSKVTIQHRIRLEERFLSVYDPILEKYNYKDMVFTTRFRYRFGLDWLLYKGIYFTFFDELFIKADNGMKAVNFDRNWFYTGIGYHFSKAFTLQAAYLLQYNRKNDLLYERHHGISVNAFWHIR